MAELYGVNLALHLESILSEFASSATIYGYPKRKMYLGFPGLDLSVNFHDRKAATLLGPASGPHSQMVQNIVLAFLGGGRIMELKTVQILDQLKIPRPCIDVRNVGYNVEWSQEMRLEDSYDEYVTAWVLLKIIEETEILGVPRGDPFYDTIFDISVGYDLKGIRSQPMHKWLSEFKSAEAAIERILDSLPAKFAQFKKLKINPEISNSTTLSTFHGCPGDEIESIVEHLISEHGFHVIVKMNPTILGYDFVDKTLRRDLGYKNIELDAQAFENDVSFKEAVAIMKRLKKFAEKYKRNVGAKFTNTLVVKNNENIFKDEVQYLSGAPLHVLSMNAMHQFRTAMGGDFHISFSAGITKHNFVDTVCCNMKPITTCTDLLKTGGYTRMFDYLTNLKRAMEESSCRTVGEFIMATADKNEQHNVFSAGASNARRVVPALIENRRYHSTMNQKSPPKIDSHLALFDCITCNKCLPVCPNAANFSIPTGAMRVPMTNLKYVSGSFEAINGQEFVLTKEHQIANLADFCNECGDCDTYCPEFGGPFIEKPRFFFSKSSYKTHNEYDGFYFPTPNSMTGRIQKREYFLSRAPEKGEYLWRDSDVEITLDAENQFLSGRALNGLANETEIDMKPFYIMRTLFDGIVSSQESYWSVMVQGSA